MLPYRSGLCAIVLLAGALALCLQSAGQARATGDEQALWKLERAYWSYVQDNDLKGYLSLWHQDFLGWPSVHAAPVHKDHITDWITAQTSKGLRLEAAEFKPAAIQVTGDVAVTCYRITFKWADRDGNGTTHTLRILHTFVREGKDWQIMGGMSMPEGPVAP